MNFLLHYQLATRDLRSPTAGAGAMLPDLWRMADRRVRPKRGGVPLGDADGALSVTLAGIAHHVSADRWFHADPVFLDGEKQAGRALRESGVSAPRMILFAHVLWELCLDGALLDRVGLAPMLDGLREGFAALSLGASDAAAARHHFAHTARTEEERALFGRRMVRIAEELLRGPWIEGYQHGEGIALRIQGVRARLGMREMERDDHRRLAGAADRLLEAAPAVVDRILARAPLLA